ncbi:MAG: transcriptional repressor [Treponema sp.]|jgi:Fur family peroxide stress response transcriptional regulator|nr:transcriptional repressor [Treponema sp.]
MLSEPRTARKKRSLQREAILELLRSTGSHPGAQWVYDQLRPLIPGLSLGTVYRNISFFRKEGQVNSLGVINGEERFDGVTEPHPHLVCSRCGKVFDLPKEQVEVLTDRRGGTWGGDAGFTIDFHRTVFYGLCGLCGRRPPDTGTPAVERAV